MADPTRESLQRLVDGVQTLIREHLALARAELKDDLRSLGRDLIAGAAGLPALATGYLLFMFALGLLLALWLPHWAAFGIVALCNLAAGGFISFIRGKRIIERGVELRRTSEELQRDRAWLASMRAPEDVHHA